MGVCGCISAPHQWGGSRLVTMWTEACEASVLLKSYLLDLGSSVWVQPSLLILNPRQMPAQSRQAPCLLEVTGSANCLYATYGSKVVD